MAFCIPRVDAVPNLDLRCSVRSIGVCDASSHEAKGQPLLLWDSHRVAPGCPVTTPNNFSGALTKHVDLRPRPITEKNVSMRCSPDKGDEVVDDKVAVSAFLYGVTRSTAGYVFACNVAEALQGKLSALTRANLPFNLEGRLAWCCRATDQRARQRYGR